MVFEPQKLFAERIGGEQFGKDTTVYKFEKIKRARKAFQAAHPEIPVINVGVGEHDGLEPEIVSDTIAKEVRLPRNRGYPDNGILEFQQAAASYLNNMLGINLPTDERAANHIIHGFGSKNILSLLPLSYINPARAPLEPDMPWRKPDVTLMTVPGYAVLGTWTKYLGGKVVNLPLREENGFLPDLKKLEEDIPRIEAEQGKIKLLCLNYPNNPTGADATIEMYNLALRLASKYNFTVVQDAAYCGLEHEGRKPVGILQAEGGLEGSVAAYSMSKAFDMIGRRIAFLATGRPILLAAHANIKDNSDSGQDSAIQRGAMEALKHPEFTREIASKYARRLGRLVDILNRNGFSARMPAGSFFLYVRAPTGAEGASFAKAEDATEYLLTQKGISTVPWDDAGHYLRFSATFDAGEGTYENLAGYPEADEKVFRELDKRLASAKLKFG